MFKAVSIEGYRGIGQLSISDLKRVNLIVGKNNCGKTTVLESLFFLSNPGNVQLPIRTANFRQYIVNNEHDWPLFFNRLDIEKSIHFTAELARPRENRVLDIRPHRQSRTASALRSTQQGTLPEQLRDNISGTGSAMTGLDFEFSISEPGQGKKPKNFQASVQIAQGVPPPGTQTIGVGPTLMAQPPQDYRETLSASFLTPTNILGGLAQRFSDLQTRKQIDKVVKALRQIEPSLKALALGSEGLVWADVGLTNLIPINTMGDGMVRLLAIILAISATPKGVILVDEIENGFHYSSLGVLWDAVLEAAADADVQVVASTHSMECARAFTSTSEKFLATSDEVRLIRLEKSASGIKAVSFDRTKLRTAIEQEWEVR